jgi:CTP synthase (UTP-ammonia lyase)
MLQESVRMASNEESTVIGIVGDRNAQHPLHLATENSLLDGPHAPRVEWIPTDRIMNSVGGSLTRYAGFLISPGSPYRSMDGALTIIRYARENRVPLLGTCGGFQHLIVEFARNVAALSDADHAETNPAAARLAVTPLECSLAGQIHPVRLVAGTQAAAIYAVEETLEPFFCSYGINPEYRPLLETHGLAISGVDERGEVRIVELPSHPFFLGTLYVPQARHKPREPHPLIRAFVEAAGRERINAQRLSA